MTDQMQPHVAAIAQAVESFAQCVDVIVRNPRHPGLEVNGRNDVLELHGLEALGCHLPLLEAVARLGLDLLGIARRRCERRLHRQMPLDRAAERRLADGLRLCAERDQRDATEEPGAMSPQAAHAAPRSRSTGYFGGLPRSQ